MRQSAITGAILGTAAGDALGLPYEGLRPGERRGLLGEPDRHRLLVGRGMVSDDTEHACMTMQALDRCGRRREPLCPRAGKAIAVVACGDAGWCGVGHGARRCGCGEACRLTPVECTRPGTGRRCEVRYWERRRRSRSSSTSGFRFDAADS